MSLRNRRELFFNNADGQVMVAAYTVQGDSLGNSLRPQSMAVSLEATDELMALVMSCHLDGQGMSRQLNSPPRSMMGMIWSFIDVD